MNFDAASNINVNPKANAYDSDSGTLTADTTGTGKFAVDPTYGGSGPAFVTINLTGGASNGAAAAITTEFTVTLAPAGTTYTCNISTPAGTPASGSASVTIPTVAASDMVTITGIITHGPTATSLASKYKVSMELF